MLNFLFLMLYLLISKFPLSLLNIPFTDNPVRTHIFSDLWGQESLLPMVSVGGVCFLQVAFSLVSVSLIGIPWILGDHWLSSCIKYRTLRRGGAVCIRGLFAGFATGRCDPGQHLGPMSAHFLFSWLDYPEDSSSLLPRKHRPGW